MTFEWKHPNYYKELKKLRENETNQESDNKKDKESNDFLEQDSELD
jgi:hypothetical protein